MSGKANSRNFSILFETIVRLQPDVFVNQWVALPLTECLLGGLITQPQHCSNVLSRSPGFNKSFENDDNADEILAFESQLPRHHEGAMLFFLGDHQAEFAPAETG